MHQTTLPSSVQAFEGSDTTKMAAQWVAIYPRIVYRPWCYGPWVVGQALEGSGTIRMAVQWVAEPIQELCIVPGAVAPVCLGKPMGAVAPPKWQCSG